MIHFTPFPSSPTIAPSIRTSLALLARAGLALGWLTLGSRWAGAGLAR